MNWIYQKSIILYYTLTSCFLTWLPNVYTNGKVGSIVCKCNTWDCEEQSRVLCTTDFQCYVQVTYNEDSEPDIKYGCLAQHSILCQNPKPRNYQGNWPIVQCCSENFCNKDLMPTEPPEWHKEKSSTSSASTTTTSTTTTVLAVNISSEQKLFHSGQSSTDSSSSSSSSINPFYIAFPIVGAIVLILLIIFAVYILKRQQPSSSREYKYHSALKPKPRELGHNALIVNNAAHMKHNGLVIGPHKQLPVMAVEKLLNGRPPEKDLEKGAREREVSNGFITDGEGSSTGSERKLLV